MSIGWRLAQLAAFVSLLVAAPALAERVASGQPRQMLIPAVQARAKAVSLKLSDLPTAQTWKPSRQSAANKALPHCANYHPDLSDLIENGQFYSPNFTLPNRSYIGSDVSIFASAKQGQTAYARVVKPQLPGCQAETVVRSAAGQAFHVVVVSAGPLAFPRLADRSAAFRVVLDVKQGSQTTRVYADAVALDHGATVVHLSFFGVGKPFGTLETSVAKTIAARITH